MFLGFYTSMNRYLLFYPSVEIGGAEILLARLADALVDRGNEVTVMDSENKIIIDLLKDKRVRTLIVCPREKIEVCADYVVIFASHLISAPRFFNASAKSKLLVWNIHPLNNIFLPPVFGERIFNVGLGFLRKVNKLFFCSEDTVRINTLKAFFHSDAFVCMDGETAKTLNNYYGLNFSYDYIPVPVPIFDNNLHTLHELDKSGVINLFWYGRLCDFKSHGLIYLIKKLSEFKFKIRLGVIGDGDFRETVEKVAKSSAVQVCFFGSLPNQEALSLLQREADVVFAMGTSALEAAAIGIPTVLAPVSYGKIIHNLKFDWLYNTKNFTLGRLVGVGEYEEGLSVNEIIYNAIINRDFFGKSCRQYVYDYHELSSVVDLVQLKASQSKMKFSDYCQLVDYKRPFLIRLSIFLRARIKHVIS